MRFVRREEELHIRWRPLVVSCCFFPLMMAPAVASSTEEVDSLRTVRVTEQHLRSLVERSELPDVSAATLLEDSGPAVAEIMISAQGKMVAVSILEAPTLEVAEALRNSLVRWGFKSAKIYGSAYVVGKLTFYFDRIGGQTVIKMPVMKDETRIASSSAAQP